VLLPIDVVQEVDGVLDHAVANVAIVTARLRGGCVLVDDHALAQLAVQVHLVVASLEVLPLHGLWRGLEVKEIR